MYDMCITPVNGIMYRTYTNVDVNRGDSFANFGRDDIDSRLEFSMTSLFFVLSKIYLLQPHAFLLIIIVQNKGEIDLADQKKWSLSESLNF